MNEIKLFNYKSNLTDKVLVELTLQQLKRCVKAYLSMFHPLIERLWRNKNYLN